jgi:hypothetical protein
MPEIVRLRRCKICMYPGDHRPPHFHVRGSGWGVAVDLLTFAVRGRGEKAAIEEAIAWAQVFENGERLMQEWRRLNERE